MIDLHVHTHHSYDSKAVMEDYCKRALQLGVDYICFTDHIDCNQVDDGYHYYVSEKYFTELEAAQEKYAGQLTLLSGIEFGEPHIYQKEFDHYRNLPYDFILGSVHYWYENMFASQLVNSTIALADSFQRYWEEVYKAVEYGGFDALAHMDFPKRYYKKCLWTEAEIMDILKVMVKNQIALEINSSSLRKGLSVTLPDQEFLKIYEEAGGERVTIGSDAHRVEELAHGYEFVKKLIAGKLKSTLYIERKPVLETSI